MPKLSSTKNNPHISRRGGNRTHVTQAYLACALGVYKAPPSANISNPPFIIRNLVVTNGFEPIL